MQVVWFSKIRLYVLPLLLVSYLVFTACSKHKPVNEVKLDEFVAKLKSENPDCTCGPYLKEYAWRDQVIYLLGYRGPGCDWIPAYYTEDLIKFEMTPGYTFDKFVQESRLMKEIWNCP